ncbi:MAG: hypothetical protein DHS20C15_34950 [Planctomycetota bacterium]|nr:MAG: hypothetical protein DHS20C15_34950 [Planctomycetota bacterium]
MYVFVVGGHHDTVTVYLNLGKVCVCVHVNHNTGCGACVHLDV